MAFNALMHPRNLYKDNPPNFKELATKFPEFKKCCAVDLSGKVAIDFKNPESVRALTRALLKNDFDLDVELPSDSLVPRVPLRLNYILWLQDIIGQAADGKMDREVWGVDIGTGASCVYPLLGATTAGWHFVATERDAVSVEVAKRNVERNGFDHLVDVIKVDEKTALCGVVDSTSSSERTFDFCMCNPPFYDVSGELAYGASAGRPGRPEPHSTTIAKLNEVCAEGGEVGFISRIIDDSKKLGTRVRVYTSMIGKKASLGPLKAKLREMKVTDICVTTFSQGKTQRWALAWTFVDDLKLNAANQGDKKKNRSPLLYEVPSSAVCPYTFPAVVDKVLKVLDELKVTHKEKESVQRSAFSKYVRYLAEASHNTWSHNRRKRRAVERCEKYEPAKRRKEGCDVHATSGSTQKDKVNSDQDHVSLTTRNGNGASMPDPDHPSQLTGPSSAKPEASVETKEPKPLLSFDLAIKLWDTKIVIELQFIEGENPDALHQILQFLKNRLQ